MSTNTKIEWTDHTFNPWEGCQKVGPGCDHCYAETRNARFGGGQAVNWGPGAPRRRTSASNWELPKRWNAQAAAFMAQHGRRQRVFCASLADVFDNAVDSEWRQDLANLILDTPNLDWLLLTKRIGNAGRMLGEMFLDGTPDNLGIGATITSQPEADRDITKLLTVPARMRFLSMEPLLGPVNLWLPTRRWENSAGDASCDHCCNGDRCDDPTHYERGRPEWKIRCPYCRGTGNGNPIDWVIVGGESGPGARPMHPQWARDLRDQCAAAGVPFLFKQWGEWVPRGPESMGYPLVDDVPRVRLTDLGENGGDLAAEGGNHIWMQRAGKKAAGRLLDGSQHDGFPA